MHRCNMKCPFCFIPYNDSTTDFDICKKIIQRCLNLEIGIITFGGGDPFKYKEIRDLIAFAYHSGFEVQIDTNGLGLKANDYSLIEEHCSLLSLPLDASTGIIHDQLRVYNGHFDLVVNHLQNMKNYNIRLKVNTVVTKQNVDDLINMPDLLNNLNVNIWSLYQFYPQHSAKECENIYSITDNNFNDLVDKISAKSKNFVFEPGTIDQRTGSYLFVSPNGLLYTHNPEKKGEYLFLGDFFSQTSFNRYFQIYEETYRNQISHRYKTLTNR